MDTAEREAITKNILMDVLNAVHALYEQDGLEAVTAHAKMANKVHEAMALLAEVIGYAKANSESASLKDDRETWGVHHRNLIKVQRLILGSQSAMLANERH
jgi:2-phospho-L-lactate guanylyltransferase (CobY/MobA/RfbA family)